MCIVLTQSVWGPVPTAGIVEQQQNSKTQSIPGKGVRLPVAGGGGLLDAALTEDAGWQRACSTVLCFQLCIVFVSFRTLLHCAAGEGVCCFVQLPSRLVSDVFSLLCPGGWHM